MNKSEIEKIRRFSPSERKREEFYCQECKHYFLTYLRQNMYGNYTIQCPNEACKHHHFRVVKHGHVTEDRHNSKYSEMNSELLPGLKATLRKTPYWNDPDYPDIAEQNRKNMVAVK